MSRNSELVRASFESFAAKLRAQGISEEKIRSILKKLIEQDLCEGNDETGYIITEKGITIVEKQIYGKLGVV